MVDKISKVRDKKIFAISAIIIATAIWGIATPVVKHTVSDVPPFSFLALRFGLASVLCLPIAIYFLRKTKFNWHRVKKIILATLIGHVITLSLFFIGISRTTAVEGSFITAFSPLVMSFLAFLILKERIRRTEIEGLLIAFIGVLIIIAEPIITNPEAGQLARLSFIGNIILLLAVVSDALYNLYIKKHIVHDKVITPINLVIFAYIIAFIAFIPLALLEQANLYNNATRTKFHILNQCTINDFDVDNYRDDIACDNNGCYRRNFEKNENTYFCKSPELNQNRISFSEYLKGNLTKYFSLENFGGIAYMAFISGLIAYSLFAFGLKYVEVSDAAPFLYTQPIFGISVAVIFLGEHISVTSIVAACLAAIGIIYSIKRKN